MFKDKWEDFKRKNNENWKVNYYYSLIS